MSSRLHRRKFLRNASAAAGAAALFSQAGLSFGAEKPAAPGADIANTDLTRASVAKVQWKVEPFSMTDVRLLPGMWKEMMERNRSFLYSLPNDRLAHNFRVTAGLPSDAEPLGGWERPDCELRGHYVGHYLSACAMLYSSTGDEFIRRKADELVAMLAACQAKDGYLGAYPTELYDRLRQLKQVWAPFYTYHKIMAGMIDMYEHTGNKQALEVALKMADWAADYSRPISDEQWQKVLLIEHGGMMESAFNLYAITGNTKYRDLAYRFEQPRSSILWRRAKTRSRAITQIPTSPRSLARRGGMSSPATSASRPSARTSTASSPKIMHTAPAEPAITRAGARRTQLRANWVPMPRSAAALTT